MTETWIFTFGYGHLFPNKYVKIKGSYESAREKMVEHFGTKWAFQYPLNKEEELQKHDITELEGFNKNL